MNQAKDILKRLTYSMRQIEKDQGEYILTRKSNKIISEALDYLDDPRPVEDDVVLCDKCEHFPPPESAQWQKRTVHNLHVCMRGRIMLFKVPVNHPDYDDNWGFYSKSCRYFCKKNK